MASAAFFGVIPGRLEASILCQPTAELLAEPGTGHRERMVGGFFYAILYQPLFNALILLYEFLPGRDLGLAIIVLTVLVRLALSPLLTRQIRSQKKLAALQKDVGEIRKATKDRAEQSQRMLALYKHHGVSPVSGCLPVLVQLPVLWAMYAVLREGVRPEALAALYAFVPRPETIEPVMFGLLRLQEPAFQRGGAGFTFSWPAVILALLTGVVSYWQARLTPGLQKKHTLAEDTTPTERMAHQMNQQMLVLMPLMTTYFALVFPAGLALYWFVTTLVSVLQQRILLKRLS